jgi:hypothetical protein
MLLMQLPDSLTTLTNLRVLGLTSNRLWQLPPGIAGCASLRVLDCSHNLLSRLPAGMGSMARLRSVKLTHNKLGWVPVWEFQELPGLQELHLAGNAFTVRVQQRLVLCSCGAVLRHEANLSVWTVCVCVLRVVPQVGNCYTGCADCVLTLLVTLTNRTFYCAVDCMLHAVGCGAGCQRRCSSAGAAGGHCRQPSSPAASPAAELQPQRQQRLQQLEQLQPIPC